MYHLFLFVVFVRSIRDVSVMEIVQKHLISPLEKNVQIIGPVNKTLGMRATKNKG